MIDQVLYGKLPPQAVDIEDAVLGALMTDKRIHHAIIPQLTAEVFYKPQNYETFQAIEGLYLDHEPIDILTVTEHLKSKGNLEAVGGPYYLTQLTNLVSSGANTKTHCKILLEKWMSREVIRIGSQYIQSAYDDETDVFDMVNELQTDVMGLLRHIDTGNSRHVGQVVNEVYERALKAKENPQKLVGIPSGFIDLDRITNGWKEPDLIIVAARPGMGKTAFVLNMARNASELGDPIGLFSLEMSSHQLTQRLLAMESTVQTGDIERGNFEVRDLDPYVKKISGLPIYLNDKAAISSMEIMTASRKMVVEHGVKMICIDYIQLVSDRTIKGANREQQVSNISRSFKMMAKELQVPVIALSQLSRSVESRSDKRPILSDLRESGAIEQDADMVLFLYRGDYYGETENEEGENTKGIVEVNIAKHRSGALGTVELKWDEKYTTFKDMDNLGSYGIDNNPF